MMNHMRNYIVLCALIATAHAAHALLPASWLYFYDEPTKTALQLKLKDLYPYVQTQSCHRAQPAPGQPIVNIFVPGTAIAQAPASRTSLFIYPGLHQIDPFQTTPQPVFPASIQNIYRIAMTTLSEIDPTRFPPDSLYLYGWSGLLSVTERLKEGAFLYGRILQLLQRFASEGKPKPFLRLITHSHGGNVTLNLTQYKDCFDDPVGSGNFQTFDVDELIMLACPVQKYTVNFLSDPMFKNSITFFSPTDFVQIYDPQDLFLAKPGKELFSRRIFPENPNLAQIRLIINRGSIQHIDFVRQKIILPLPGLLDQVDQLKQPGVPLFTTLEVFV